MITGNHRFEVGFTFRKDGIAYKVLLQPNEYDNQPYYVVKATSEVFSDPHEISSQRVLKLTEEEIIYLIYDLDYKV